MKRGHFLMKFTVGYYCGYNIFKYSLRIIISYVINIYLIYYLFTGPLQNIIPPLRSKIFSMLAFFSILYAMELLLPE